MRTPSIDCGQEPGRMVTRSYLHKGGQASRDSVSCSKAMRTCVLLSSFKRESIQQEKSISHWLLISRKIESKAGSKGLKKKDARDMEEMHVDSDIVEPSAMFNVSKKREKEKGFR